MKTPEEEWAEFRDRVFPDIGPAEREHIERQVRPAFVAGMLAAATSAHLADGPAEVWRLYNLAKAAIDREIAAFVARPEARAAPGDGDCRDSSEPREIRVSLCVTHRRVELWLDGTPWALSAGRAEAVGAALGKAGSEAKAL